ncbi:MAG: glycosyltransferase [Planctomycetaceae bacterium]
MQWYLFFPGSGIGRYTHAILQQFQQVEDVEAELVCLPSYEWLQSADYRIWPGLRVFTHSNPVRRKLRFVAAQAINPARLWRRVREQRADVVHLSNINHLTYPLWRRWLEESGARVVATAHDVRRAKAMVSRAYEDRQLQQFYRRADALFVHSRAQLKDLVDFAKVPEERIHIVPHGPYNYGQPSADQQELRQRLGWPIDKQVALFFGNIRDDKNLGLMLEALRPYRDEVHLVVAGRVAGDAHKTVADYSEMAQRLGLTEAVTFDNRYISDAEIPDLFTACDWAALPYSRRFTSQSGVLNVAVSYQRPVLISATPTFVETLERAEVGLLAEPDDVETLRSGIGRMITAVVAGREFAFAEYERQFGWEANVRITRDVYRSLCG